MKVYDKFARPPNHFNGMEILHSPLEKPYAAWNIVSQRTSGVFDLSVVAQFAHVYTSDSCLVCCLLLDPGRRRRHTPIIFCGTIPGSEFRKIKLKNLEARHSIKKAT